MTGDRDIPKRWQGIEPDGVAKQGVVHDRHRTDKYDVFGVLQGLGERLIFSRRRRFGKKNIETNDASAGLMEFPDQLGMETAGPGPLLPHLGHGGFVNGDDDDVFRRGKRKRTG